MKDDQVVLQWSNLWQAQRLFAPRSSPPEPVEVVENDVESMTMAKIVEFWQLKSNPLKRIMEALFPNLESELTGFLNQGHTIDGYNSLYALVRMSEHVSSAQSPQSGAFLAITFGSCLIQVSTVSVSRSFEKDFDKDGCFYFLKLVP